YARAPFMVRSAGGSSLEGALRGYSTDRRGTLRTGRIFWANVRPASGETRSCGLQAAPGRLTLAPFPASPAARVFSDVVRRTGQFWDPPAQGRGARCRPKTLGKLFFAPGRTGPQETPGRPAAKGGRGRRGPQRVQELLPSRRGRPVRATFRPRRPLAAAGTPHPA